MQSEKAEMKMQPDNFGDQSEVAHRNRTAIRSEASPRKIEQPVAAKKCRKWRAEKWRPLKNPGP